MDDYEKLLEATIARRNANETRLKTIAKQIQAKAEAKAKAEAATPPPPIAAPPTLRARAQPEDYNPWGPLWVHPGAKQIA